MKTLKKSSILSTLLALFFYQSMIAQTFNQRFESKSTFDITLTKNGKEVAKIPKQGTHNLNVTEGDRLIVNVPGYDEYGSEPIYISARNKDKTINIFTRKNYQTFNAIITKTEILVLHQNLTGMDIADYDPLNVTGSFKSNNIFRDIETSSFDYDLSGGKIVPSGFNYTGSDNIVKGEDNVMQYKNSHDFQESMSAGLQVEVPVKAVTVGAGFTFKSLKKESHEVNDIFYSSTVQYDGFTVSLLPENLRRVQLTEGFKNAVKSINNKADAKRNIINIYGSHYPETVTYGGYWKSWKQVSQRDYLQLEKKGVDVNLSVKVATPGKQIEKTYPPKGGHSYKAKKVTTGSTDSSSKGNGAFSFSHETTEESKSMLSSSKGNYNSVGGYGDEAAAIKAKLKLISHLVYPDIFKDGSTEKMLKQKRQWLDEALVDHINSLPKKSPKQAAYKLYKVKLKSAKRIDELDDANKEMKGYIKIKTGGGNPDHYFWKRDQFSLNNLNGTTLRMKPSEHDYAIIKVPYNNGVPQDIYLKTETVITNKDDAFGHDDHTDLNGGGLNLRLKDIRSLQEKSYVVKYNNTVFERSAWEVTLIILPIPNHGMSNWSPSGNNQAFETTRSATRSTTVSNVTPSRPISMAGKVTQEEFNKAAFGNPNLTATTATKSTVKEVKFYQKNGISITDAQKIASQNGWNIATSSEVAAAFSQMSLDVYAFGMMSDGRFAVPVQRDHSNFKKGHNIGATGGNQGFFYVVSGSATASTPTTTASPTTIPKSTPVVNSTSTTKSVSKTINGRNVKVVIYSNGTFEQAGAKTWHEKGLNGKTSFVFEETGRDDWSVYLLDKKRNAYIMLNLWKKDISYKTKATAKYGKLYTITGTR